MYKWRVDLDAERQEFLRRAEESAKWDAEFEKEEEEERIRRESGQVVEKQEPEECVEDDDDWDGMTYEEFIAKESELIEEEMAYVSVGDEVERIDGRGGIVLGRICNHEGKAVCYKVWVQSEDGGYVDYYQADDILYNEWCGDTFWSLNRIGYEVVEEESGFSYLYNKETGDVELW